MNRPLYTVLYSLMIIVIFFGLSTVYLSCGNNKKNKAEDTDLAEKIEKVADDYTDETFFEDSDEPSNTGIGLSQGEEENEDDAVTSSPPPRTTSSATQRGPAIIRTGGYVVIAGNYLLENNADVMVRKLNASGYNQAEKVVFDLSQYYTVIAGRYETRNLANSISSELSAKGIDNYVLSRK